MARRQLLLSSPTSAFHTSQPGKNSIVPSLDDRITSAKNFHVTEHYAKRQLSLELLGLVKFRSLDHHRCPRNSKQAFVNQPDIRDKRKADRPEFRSYDGPMGSLRCDVAEATTTPKRFRLPQSHVIALKMRPSFLFRKVGEPTASTREPPPLESDEYSAFAPKTYSPTNEHFETPRVQNEPRSLMDSTPPPLKARHTYRDSESPYPPNVRLPLW